jgi:hypothetical protein
MERGDRVAVRRKEKKMVRAKFKVDEIKRMRTSIPKVEDGNPGKVKWTDGELRTIIMSPVYGNGDPNHENTKFWQASPSGKFELGCANLAATEQFELGKEYYLDISPAS